MQPNTLPDSLQTKFVENSSFGSSTTFEVAVERDGLRFKEGNAQVC